MCSRYICISKWRGWKPVFIIVCNHIWIVFVTDTVFICFETEAMTGEMRNFYIKGDLQATRVTHTLISKVPTYVCIQSAIPFQVRSSVRTKDLYFIINRFRTCIYWPLLCLFLFLLLIICWTVVGIHCTALGQK